MKAMNTLILFQTLLFTLVTSFAQAQEFGENITPDTQTAPAETASPPVVEGCIPACRAAYMCHAGMCISKCNPPCAAGQSCTDEGECIALPAPAPVAGPPTPAAPIDELRLKRELTRQQARERKQKIRAQRLAAVSQFRVGLHMDWQWSFTEIYRTGLLGNLGFQKNLVDTFALRARVGGMVGYARPDFFDGGERTTCWGANVDFSPLFGPLGNFYIGPTLWMTWYWHGKESLESDYDNDVEDTNSGITGGIALDTGIVVGSDANLGINWRIKSNLIDEEPGFTFEFGLAYHFPVGEQRATLNH